MGAQLSSAELQLIVDSEVFPTPEASAGGHKAPREQPKDHRTPELAGKAAMRLLWQKQTADG
jgi:hypothetical protein